jgi:hypothetical protein
MGITNKYFEFAFRYMLYRLYYFSKRKYILMHVWGLKYIPLFHNKADYQWLKKMFKKPSLRKKNTFRYSTNIT